MLTEDPPPERVTGDHVHDGDDIRDILHTHTEPAALLKDHRATGLARSFMLEVCGWHPTRQSFIELVLMTQKLSSFRFRVSNLSATH